MKSLYECYSRLLIDNHISDRKPEYMSRFAPREYVRMVRMTGVESSMVYACDHNGNCYYPARTGHMHAGLCGRDIFGETVELLGQSGIVPVAYYTVVYHNESALSHPEWRMRDSRGAEREGRYRFSCPNHPGYRKFCMEQLGEILHYPLGGIFIDMTFWPLVCCCDACRAAYGKPVPEIIDWNDPEWVDFQRFREYSLAEFARQLTGHVKTLRPELPATCQFSPVLHGWRFGLSSELAAANDYSSGDFYGGKLQQRLGAKVFAAYSRRTPYEFMTSRCVTLFDHTSTKSDEELYLHAVTTLLNGGAYFFIDAINPDGTLEESFYRRLRGIVRKLEPFREVIARHRPHLSAGTGIYFSLASNINTATNGIRLFDLNQSGGNMNRHNCIVTDETLGFGEILNRMHIPYRILTDRTEDFSGLKTIIVPHAAYLSAAEVERLREFVRNGGMLLATGPTSLYDRSGHSTGNFQLADVFGIDYSGQDSDRVNYLETADGIFSGYTPSPLVTARPGTDVHGFAVLPDFPPGDPDAYASIHSDPPGIRTGYAGLTENRFGQGSCFYLYSALAAERHCSQQSLLRKLLERCAPVFVTASRNLPESVELTLLESEDRRTLLLGIVNYQEELPNIPLIDVEFTVRLPVNPTRIIRASDGREIPSDYRNDELTLRLERLDHAELFILNQS